MTDGFMRPHRTLTHRTIGNVCRIEGLAGAVRTHAKHMRDAIEQGDESKLQAALADFMLDAKALESTIVEQEQ